MGSSQEVLKPYDNNLFNSQCELLAGISQAKSMNVVPLEKLSSDKSK